jgi:hypothetical protein
MRIAIGCDHRGFEVKTKLMELVAKLGPQYKRFAMRAGVSSFASVFMIVFRPFIRGARFILQLENFVQRCHIYSSE